MHNLQTENDLTELGQMLVELSNQGNESPYDSLIKKAKAENQWFTDESIQQAFTSIGNSLTTASLQKWLSKYNLPKIPAPKQIGLVLAGNLPLVGLHDILCVLVTGNIAVVKLSSKDQHLYKIVVDMLCTINPLYATQILFTDQNINNVDAIIATGSDNSARYFEYYFGKYPHIIRKNRNSVAILSGNESDEELSNLGTDIFTYFGLGCRNVSHIIMPDGFEIDRLYKNFAAFASLINHNKYANNYDYQKTIMLLNQTPFFDNGLVLLKQDQSLSSPIAVIHYQYYKNIQDVENYIEQNKHKIQCIVSKTKWSFLTYELGKAQYPELWDYADNMDTIEFLLNLN